ASRSRFGVLTMGCPAQLMTFHFISSTMRKRMLGWAAAKSCAAASEKRKTRSRRRVVFIFGGSGVNSFFLLLSVSFCLLWIAVGGRCLAPAPGAGFHRHGHLGEPSIVELRQFCNFLRSLVAKVILLGNVLAKVEQLDPGLLRDQLPIAGTHRPPTFLA